MGRLFPSLPRRRCSQPQPRSVYTFHRGEAISSDRGRGTAYVRNAVVRNRHGDIRYTVATANKQTTVRDRYEEVVARIDWGHTRYPRIAYRNAGVIECCRWFKYGVARVTRTVRANSQTYRWARVDREDTFTWTREQDGAPPACIAGVNDQGLLAAEFQEAARARPVKDALIVALVLLHGENRWLKLGQIGPNPQRYMKNTLKVALAGIKLAGSFASAV